MWSGDSSPIAVKMTWQDTTKGDWCEKTRDPDASLSGNALECNAKALKTRRGSAPQARH
jgi:hypothetical protein